MGQEQSIQFRSLEAKDVTQLHQLVNQSHPLDQNSTYCNLLQCTHFRETSVAALIGEKLVGFVTAYVLPMEPGRLFVWQLAVDELRRGTGLAKQMLNWLITKPTLKCITQLTATITPSNQASCGLFESIALEWGADAEKRLLLQPDLHLDGLHDDEYELRIAPLPNRSPGEEMRHHLDLLKAGFRTPIIWKRFD
jgi:L-2,4-diaminobutyric acid acetyltransferase